MPTILVADNRKVFVELVRSMLEKVGYAVVTALTPADAARVLADGGCDAAVLDYRLLDDGPTDRSGLDLAEKSDPNIPKILVSDLTEKEDVMAAVQVGRDGRPIAVRFLAKNEIDPRNPKLADTVRVALEIGKQWKRQVRERIRPELYRDYNRAALFAQIQDIVHIVANAAFVALMVWGAVEIHGGVWRMVFMIGGVMVGEIVNLLLARKGETWKERAERYHQELLQADRFEELLAACESLNDSDAIVRAREQVIQRASEQWIGAASQR
jgi:CheY-like chemotaxis protein